MKNPQLRSVFFSGMKDGIPIGLGYFAVAFSLGISARNAGLKPIEGFLSSLLNHASAGEYAGYSVIQEKGTFLSVIIITLIANARYFLMSCALSQRLDQSCSLIHRIGIGFGLTDEIFSITISKNVLYPAYTYGAMLTAIPSWALGTMIGITAGNILPGRLTSALSVALYGMFLATIIPPARKSRILAILITCCFLLSGLVEYLPFLSAISSGTKTIILTVVIASAAALLFPVRESENEEHIN